GREIGQIAVLHGHVAVDGVPGGADRGGVVHGRDGEGAVDPDGSGAGGRRRRRLPRLRAGPRLGRVHGPRRRPRVDRSRRRARGEEQHRAGECIVGPGGAVVLIAAALAQQPLPTEPDLYGRDAVANGWVHTCEAVGVLGLGVAFAGGYVAFHS